MLSLAPLLVKQAQTSIALLLDIVHIGDPHGLVRLSLEPTCMTLQSP